MNAFRLVGDMTHLASFFILILRLYAARSAAGNTKSDRTDSRNVAGISLKSQELFLMTFVFRYTDVFYRYISAYNTIMKILYILLSAAIVWVADCTCKCSDCYCFVQLRFAIQRALEEYPRQESGHIFALEICGGSMRSSFTDCEWTLYFQTCKSACDIL